MIKKLVLVITLISMIGSTSLYAKPHTYYDLRCDRMLHFSFGYMTTMPLTMWTEKYFDPKNNPDKYCIISLGLPIFVGYMKEVSDQSTFNFTKWASRKPGDKSDGYYDFLAVVLGSICGKFMTYTF